MYKSNIIVFYGTKYFPLILGILFLILGFWIMIDPTFEITVNEVKREAILSDCIVPFVLSFIFLTLHFTIGQRVVKMSMTNRFINFNFKGKMITKEWTEVESINKYWLHAPPLYYVRFKNENKTFYFNSGYAFIITPVFVSDISEMGNFIKKQKKILHV